MIVLLMVCWLIASVIFIGVVLVHLGHLTRSSPKVSTRDIKTERETGGGP